MHFAVGDVARAGEDVTGCVGEDQYATKEPVPEHLRNPRRGYDETGRELKPMTIASMRGCGARGLIASCLNHECQNETRIDHAGLPDDLFVPDVALRLCCAVCSTANIRTTPDWSDLSTRYSRGITGAMGNVRKE